MFENAMAATAFFMGATHAFFTGYGLSGEPTKQNRTLSTFFALASTWSILISYAIAAPTPAQAEPWMLLSMCIRLMIPAALLHHVLLLIPGELPILRRNPLWLYLPGLLIVIILMMGEVTGQPPFSLRGSDLGWAPQWNSGWVYLLFRGSLIVGYATCWVLFVRLHATSESVRAGRASVPLLVLWMCCYALEIYAELNPGAHLPPLLPQTLTAVLLLPTGMLGSRLRGTLHAPNYSASKSKGETLILSDLGRGRIYRATGVALLLIGFYNMYEGVHLQGDYSIINALVFTAAPTISLIAMGSMLYFIHNFRLSLHRQEMLMAMVLNIFMAWLMLRFSVEGGTTIWAVAFLFLLVSTTLTYAGYIIVLGVVNVLVQAYLALSAAPVVTHIGVEAVIMRIIILLSSVGLALIVNTIYTRRLKESVQQRKYLQAVAGIASNINAAGAEDVFARGKAVLDQIASQLATNLVYCFELDKGIVRQGFVGGPSVPQDGQASPQQVGAAQALLQGGLLKAGRVSSMLGVDVLKKEAPQAMALCADCAATRLALVSSDSQQPRSVLLVVPVSEEGQETVAQEASFLRYATSALSGFFTRMDRAQRLMSMAHNDSLTGLYKRGRFTALVDERLANLQSNTRMAYIMLFDIDSFKSINDTVGHLRGDQVLSAVADRVRATSIEGELIARFSGDEFLVMGTADSREEITSRAAALLQEMRHPLDLDGQTMVLTCSLGIALYPQDGVNARELMENADFAMYAAKRDGKNRLGYYVSDDRDSVYRTMEMRNALRTALERGELLVHYQMQVDLRTRQISGVEALVRWAHPVLGIVAPSRFIPLAEEMGIIGDIDLWVAYTASAQNKAWMDRGLSDFPMSVNFSAHTLERPDIVTEVEQILQTTGLPANRLEVEMTESVAGESSEKLLRVVQQLRERGISIAIDDFGVEHSNLMRLSHIPFNRLKIDRSFVRSSGQQEGVQQRVLEHIVQMGAQLRVPLVAEGVETAAQADGLERVGFQYAQGYFFYNPMDASEAENVLRSRSIMRQLAAGGGGMW